MKRPVCACAFIIIVSSSLAACTNLGIFEDVGADPHPPQVQLLGVAFQPPAPAVGEPEEAPAFLPPDGFVVRPYDDAANTLVFRVQYFDAGGDILTIIIRDRDGTLNSSAGPTAPEVDLDGDGVPDPQPDLVYFSGTSGTADLEGVVFPPGVEGPHRIELWAEDSHGSRSPKIAFTFTVVL
jgi:hypothetical protein